MIARLAATVAALATLACASPALAQSRGLEVTVKASEQPGAADAGRIRLYSQSHALVIGIDRYTGGWPRLRTGVSDARAVAAALERQGFAVTLRTDLKADALRQELRQFFARTGRDAEARLLLWYAGHGHSEGGEGFLVPADAPAATDPDFKATALHMREFGGLVRLAAAKHVLSVFDSCFSGTIFETRSAPSSAVITRATAEPVRQFLTSGDAGQRARDDGSFATLFVRALAGDERADFNGDGYVTGEELGLFLSQRMTGLTGGAQTPRHGKLLDVKYDRGDFVFALPRAPGPPGPPERGAPDLLAWAQIKDSQRAEDFETFLKAYPQSAMAPFAQQRLAAFAPRPPSAPEIVEVDGSYVALRTANVRAEPRANAAPLGQAKAEEIVAATGRLRDGSWLRVTWQGRTGWVSAALLKEIDAGEAAAWTKVKDSKRAEDFDGFVRQHPSGHFAERARGLQVALRPAPAQPAQPAQPAVGVYPAPPAAPSSLPAPGTVFKDCEACPEMVVVPAGSFTMGSPENEQGRVAHEDPQHRVTIARPFAAGKYEVTFDQWDACVNSGGCNGHRPNDRVWGGRGNRPVIDVSWSDAKAYVEWLSRRSGKRYRLLTEAEWEYAARAGTTTPFHFGSTIGTDQANYDGRYAYGAGRQGEYRGRTVPVGSFPANAFGLHDVHGNVWEWVEDCWHDSYSGAPVDGSAWTSGGDCSYRVLRGGSWYSNPWVLRAAVRSWNGSGFRLDYSGFRVARTD